jgi:non-heme chloroperoxidase
MAPLTVSANGGDRSRHQAQQAEQANSSGRTPVVIIHGLWLLPSSWSNGAQLFEENG